MDLEIRGVSKTYSNGVKALGGVDLTIGKGMFGLLGPNGAGKSSVMRTIATLQDPDTGSIMFGDMNVLTEKQEFRRILGYLPQDFGVYADASAVDLLDYFARLKGVSDAKERKQHVDYLLDVVNLTKAKNINVDTFSGGMRQRFGIAQTLIGNPKVIIVDEPTAGLDPAERNRFYGILHRIGDEAVVILSTHIVGDVTNLCKNMAILAGGEIQALGTPNQLVTQIDGQLWQKNVAREQLAEFRNKHKVISTRLFDGEVQAIVQASSCPGVGFEGKVADLEDLYFTYVPKLAV